MSPDIRVIWQQHGLTALLGLATLAGLVALGVETDWGRALRKSLPVSSNKAGSGDMVAVLPGFTLPSLDNAFKESAERPLFTPARRPSAVNLASVPVMKKGQFKLSGTSVSNELALAYLLEIATGKTVRVTKGKEINGMILDTVEANRAILKQGEESEELTLRTASSPPPTKVAPPVLAGVPAVAAGPVPAAQPQPINAGPRPAQPQTPVTPNLIQPAPGSSQLPGFVMPSPPSGGTTQAAPATDSGTPVQRRRRNQTPQQQ